MVDLVLITVLGIFLAALLMYPLHRYLDKVKASKEFRKAFEKELVVLRQADTIVVYETLRDAFDRHELAVNEFRLNLRGKTLRRFDEAWYNYYHNPDGKRLAQYMSTSNHNETEERRKLALKRLKAVLEFAKQ